jgi:DNA-binding GntR family transcriptional regulator
MHTVHPSSALETREKRVLSYVESRGKFEADQAVHRSLSERAYELLVRMITRLELAPGAVLAERVLMAQLDIGRTPLREALQRLASEGLVTHRPNRGMFVADIAAADVQEIYEFRTLIDGTAVSLAATRATRAQIAALAEIHAALVQATLEDDIDRYVASDRAFHETIAAAAQNKLLAEVVPRIFNLHLRLWFYISTKAGGWHELARSHEEMTRAVLDGLRRRDSYAARVAMESYILRRHQDIRDLI